MWGGGGGFCNGRGERRKGVVGKAKKRKKDTGDAISGVDIPYHPTPAKNCESGDGGGVKTTPVSKKKCGR